MRCSRFRRLVNDYLEGSLSRELEEEIRGHASVCQECCSILDRFAGIRDMFRLPEEGEIPEASGLLEETRHRIMAAIETSEPPPRRLPKILRAPARLSFAAAGMALVVGVGIYLLSGERSAPMPESVPELMADVYRVPGVPAVPAGLPARARRSRAAGAKRMAEAAPVAPVPVSLASNRVYNFPSAERRSVARYASYSGVAHSF